MKYCMKIQKDIQTICFLYEGKVINSLLEVKDIIQNNKSNQIKIFANERENKSSHGINDNNNYNTYINNDNTNITKVIDILTISNGKYLLEN